MSKHTPGPWHVADADGLNYNIRGEPSTGYNGKHLARVFNNEANAHLIAAAPDMLVMLKVIQSDLRITVPSEAKLRDEIQKVINKAEGSDG